MTEPARIPQTPDPPRPAAAPAWRATFSEHRGLIALAILVVAAFVIWRCTASPAHDQASEQAPVEKEVVRVAGPGLLAVAPGSLLENKLAIETVKAERIDSPLLTVTGSVVARLSAGSDDAQARWDFSQPDLAAAWSDLLRARTEEPFAQQQLVKTRQLVTARVSAQTRVVDRLRQLVAAGTDSPRDLAAAEADLVQAQLEGQKQVFEAETAFTHATRARTALERQLLQAGVDPALLARLPAGTAIGVADVPESRVALVHEGQACVARFYALPGRTFAGKVGSVAPTLSNERRTLRVFFEISDPHGELRPGMFAEVGLGTEPRDALLLPADALLHVGTADYVLVSAEPNTWRVAAVELGESRGTQVEVLSGVASGDTLIGSGAILLKPVVVQSLSR